VLENNSIYRSCRVLRILTNCIS